jgi:hypothetical protein
VAGKWFFPVTSVYSINKTDRHEFTEILLKVALNTLKSLLQFKASDYPSGIFKLFLSPITGFVT